MSKQNSSARLWFVSFFILIVACKKDGTTYKIINSTPPEFHVVVVTDDNHVEKVAEATVALYKTQEDLDSNTNVYLTKKTGSNGEAVFTKAELKDQGIYFAKAEKMPMSGSNESQYLLLNDGINYLFVKIE
jgi:hypothetical protein